ncbi:MAG: hypothetical protein ABIR81_10375 [Ginsengibacter sp.]
MKKLLPLLFVAAIITSCNSKNQPAEQAIIGTSFDTSIMYKNNVFTDTATLVETQAQPAPVRNYQKQVSYPVARKRTSVKRSIPQHNNDVVHTETAAQPAPANVPATTGTSSSGADGVGTSSTEQSVPAKKEGWNNATKGAVIGGVGGAIGGAILSKKKGKGAVIGGILGAGGGYVLGRAKDKKMNQ